MRRASQWLQYDGLRYAVEASLRRGAGHDPVAAQRVLPERLVHGRRRLPRRAEARLLGRAAGVRGRAERLVRDVRLGRRRGGAGARSGATRRRGSSSSTARVVAEAEGEIAVPVERDRGDVFLLDLDGRNRYVMTTTGEPRAAARPPAGTARAARRSAEPPRRPGSDRRPCRRRRRSASRREPGRRLRRRRPRDGMFAASALAPDGSPVAGLPLRGRAHRHVRGRRARSTPASASTSSCAGRTSRAGSCPASSTARTGPRAARGSTRGSRPAGSTSPGWSPTRGRSAPTAARRRPCSRAAAGS